MIKKLLLFVLAIVILIWLLIRNFTNILYPIKYSEYIEKYAGEYHIDKNLVYAIIKQESNFNEKAISSKGAVGLMQIMNKTANEVVERTDIDEVNLYDPEINIQIGVKYFSELIDKYDNEKMAIIAYNAGTGNVDKWIKEDIISRNGENLENVPFKETNMYLRKVLKNYEIYNKLY